MSNTKIPLFLYFLLIGPFSFATIDVRVENQSKVHQVYLDKKRTDGVTYIPEPLKALQAPDFNVFRVRGNYDSLLNVVGLEYQFYERFNAPRCRFSLVVLKNVLLGNFQIKSIFAESKDGSHRDRAICSVELNSFDPFTGNADVTFTIDREKIE